MPVTFIEPEDLNAAVAEAKAYTDAEIAEIELTPGPQGEQGPQGIQGEVGPQGPAGVAGPTGPAGVAGEQGIQGPAGAQGVAGETGPQGEQGPAGIQGPVGPQGVKGDTGDAGPQGTAGAAGPAGAQGEPGVAGPQGVQGVAGPTGATGAQGPKGDTGNTGPQGPIGLTGPQGPQGDTGPQGPAGSGVSVYETEAKLSVRTESTDDAKLLALRNIIAAQTYKGTPIILDQARTYTFNNQIAGYNGMSIIVRRGAPDQARSSNPIANKINIRTTGYWINNPSGNTFGQFFEGLSMDGQAGNSFLGSSAGGVTWTSTFRDISAQNFGDLFGTTGSKWLNTACNFDGFWNINNVQNTAFSIGGSDSRMNFSQGLIDSPGNTLMGDDEYLIRFQQQSKTFVSNIYMTAERHSGILVSGSNDMVQLRGVTVEGRNAGAPALGCLIRVESNGELSVSDSWLSYAMSSPAAASLGRTDSGVVHIASGYAHLINIEYERATGVAETVPFAYFGTTAKGRVRDIYGKGFTTGKPRVMVARNGSETNAQILARVVCDNSVTVVDGTGAAVV